MKIPLSGDPDGAFIRIWRHDGLTTPALGWWPRWAHQPIRWQLTSSAGRWREQGRCWRENNSVARALYHSETSQRCAGTSIRPAWGESADAAVSSLRRSIFWTSMITTMWSRDSLPSVIRAKAGARRKRGWTPTDPTRADTSERCWPSWGTWRGNEDERSADGRRSPRGIGQTHKGIVRQRGQQSVEADGDSQQIFRFSVKPVLPLHVYLSYQRYLAGKSVVNCQGTGMELEKTIMNYCVGAI